MPYLILVICISIMVAIFALQNAMTVPLSFIAWSFESSLVIVILGAFLLGLLVAACFTLMMKARHYLKDKKLHEEIATLRREKEALEERIEMLQHTQMLHTKAEEKATPAAAFSPVGKPNAH